MSKYVKRIVCGIFAAALGITALAGCGNKKLDGTQIAAVSGEEEVTLGVASFLLRYSQAQMESYYGAYMSDGMWDTEVEEGKTYGESMKSDVMDQLEAMMLLKAHAEDYGITISEEDQKNIEAAAKTFMENNDEETIQTLAVTQEDVEKVLTLYTYQNKMFDPMVADVDTEVSDEEAAQTTITYIQVSTAATTDEEGEEVELTEDEKAAKKELAQTVLDKISQQEDVAAADMDALAKEVDEELSASTASFGSDDETLVDILKTTAAELEDGNIAGEILEGTDGYYVLRLDKAFDEEATASKKESIVSERQQEAYDALIEEWKEETEFTVHKEVWKEVTLTDQHSFTFKDTSSDVETEEGTEETGEE